MNKYALGTILGSALLGLSKKQIGSSAKIKQLCWIDARVSGQIDLRFNIYPLFGFNENVTALVDKLWDDLPKEEITETQSSEQQSSEQQSSEQQSSWEEESSEEDTEKIRVFKGNKAYHILWWDILLTAQHAITERIEEMIKEENFTFPDFWDDNVGRYSFGFETDLMQFLTENETLVRKHVEEESAYFWFYVERYEEGVEYNTTCPTEDQIAEELDRMFSDLWRTIWEYCSPTIFEEFFVTRMVSNAYDYEREIDVNGGFYIEKNGEWVPYNVPTPNIKLRKR